MGVPVPLCARARVALKRIARCDGGGDEDGDDDPEPDPDPDPDPDQDPDKSALLLRPAGSKPSRSHTLSVNAKRGDGVGANCVSADLAAYLRGLPAAPAPSVGLGMATTSSNEGGDERVAEAAIRGARMRCSRGVTAASGASVPFADNGDGDGTASTAKGEA